MYAPDNYDAWKAHELANEKWLGTRPICDICGEPIIDDYGYRINGDLICRDCLEEYKERIQDD